MSLKNDLPVLEILINSSSNEDTIFDKLPRFAMVLRRICMCFLSSLYIWRVSFFKEKMWNVLEKLRLYLETGSVQIIFTKIFFGHICHTHQKKHIIYIKVEAFELCWFNLCIFFLLCCILGIFPVAYYRTTSASINIYFLSVGSIVSRQKESILKGKNYPSVCAIIMNQPYFSSL